MLDLLEPVLRRLLDEVPDIKAPRVRDVLRDDYGFAGSVDLVRKRLAKLRPPRVRPAQRTGYRPGQVLQLDWGEMPARPPADEVEAAIVAEAEANRRMAIAWSARGCAGGSGGR